MTASSPFAFSVTVEDWPRRLQVVRKCRLRWSFRKRSGGRRRRDDFSSQWLASIMRYGSALAHGMEDLFLVLQQLHTVFATSLRLFVSQQWCLSPATVAHPGLAVVDVDELGKASLSLE